MAQKGSSRIRTCVARLKDGATPSSAIYAHRSRPSTLGPEPPGLLSSASLQDHSDPSFVAFDRIHVGNPFSEGVVMPGTRQA